MNQCYIICLSGCRRRKYKKFTWAVDAYESSKRLFANCWAVVTTKEVGHIRDELAQFIDATDGLMVLLSGGTAAWQNSYGANEWLKINLNIHLKPENTGKK